MRTDQAVSRKFGIPSQVPLESNAMPQQRSSPYITLHVVIGFLLMGLPTVDSCAQTYPVKPIRLILGFAPGGSTDIVTRVMAQRMSDSFGQQLVLDYREGAGGTIGTQIAAKAAPVGTR